jgi:hypothetical protein
MQLFCTYSAGRSNNQLSCQVLDTMKGVLRFLSCSTEHYRQLSLIAAIWDVVHTRRYSQGLLQIEFDLGGMP